LFTVDMRIRDLFVDRPKIKAAVKRGERIALSRIGSFLRRGARSRLRRRKRVSRPGESPSVHSSDRVATLKNILFGLEGSSVIVGPVKLNGRRGTVPALMEFGGASRQAEKQLPGGRWVAVGRRRPRPGVQTRVRQASYAPRPFMAPALAAEVAAGTIPAAWRGTVRAA
jgi:hypothetical protein